MKSRESVVRLRRFQVEDKRRQVEQIEGMIAEFDRMSDELEVQIKSEQERTGIHDSNHYAYSTFAKAAMKRRDNLRASATELRTQHETAVAELDNVLEELTKMEMLAERDQEREQVAAHHKSNQVA